MRVLIVEDDPMIGLAVLNGLKDAGYSITPPTGLHAKASAR